MTRYNPVFRKMKVNFFYSLLSEISLQKKLKKSNSEMSEHIIDEIVFSFSHDYIKEKDREFFLVLNLEKIQFLNGNKKDIAQPIRKILECCEQSGIAICSYVENEEFQSSLEKFGFVFDGGSYRQSYFYKI